MLYSEHLLTPLR